MYYTVTFKTYICLKYCAHFSKMLKPQTSKLESFSFFFLWETVLWTLLHLAKTRFFLKSNTLAYFFVFHMQHNIHVNMIYLYEYFKSAFQTFKSFAQISENLSHSIIYTFNAKSRNILQILDVSFFPQSKNNLQTKFKNSWNLGNLLLVWIVWV